jgi:hypothetical protein
VNISRSLEKLQGNVRHAILAIPVEQSDHFFLSLSGRFALKSPMEAKEGSYYLKYTLLDEKHRCTNLLKHLQKT